MTVSSATTAPSTPTVPAVPTFPWGWVLIPLVGISVLAWLWRQCMHDNEATAIDPWADAQRYIAATEAIARNHGNPVNVYIRPGKTYKLVGKIPDGHKVVLTGRTQRDWVELTDGGWVLAQHIEIFSTSNPRP